MHFDIAIGSVLGASEYVAEAVQEYLVKQNHLVECHFEPDYDQLSNDAILIVCTSTHGAGDLPDNIQAFANQLKANDLSHKKSIVIGLGDSSYDTYCQGAIQIEKILLEAGSNLLFQPLHVDVLHHPIPEDEVIKWLSKQEF